MRPSVALFALAATPISAFNLNLWPRAGSCPAVWTQVASELKVAFNGCGRNAHAAIRAVFHDCINNGCDGSLILSNECKTRPENRGLENICDDINRWRTKYKVGAADMVQFAGAMAISQCPLGPRVQGLVGRKDNNGAAAPGGIPGSRDSVARILGIFRAKGFSPADVVALLGTHSVAFQVNDDPSRGPTPLDSSPSRMDIRYYSETKFGTAPYSLQSDRALVNATETWRTWAVFTKSTARWSEAFTPAWNRLATVGNDPSQLQDCSYLIPSSRFRREEMEATEAFVAKMAKRFMS